MLKARVAVLVSGGGTNLQAIIDRQQRGKLPHAELRVVIADKEGAYALERAKTAGIKAFCVPKKAFACKAEFEADVLEILKNEKIDLIVLAGFLTILSKDFNDLYKGRILNIHPSLIPKYCGDGYYGLKVHEAALAAGEKYTGATVHFVTEVVDGGAIINQKKVKIPKGISPEDLQKKVMVEAEWVIFPKAVEAVCKQIVKEVSNNGKTKE